MTIITKGMGIILRKGDDTIKSVKPTLGKEETTTYKFRLMKKNLSKDKDKMIKFRNEKSKQMLKKQRGQK
jgi:lipopolysaccharide/colanic/teichoic acid biosynthesis glycosyltransferase